MSNNSKKAGPRVAISGINRESLLLARACALNDNPVVGIHDGDSAQALRASLFLGVSAFPTRESLSDLEPDVIVCRAVTDRLESGPFHLVVGADEVPSEMTNVCWLDLDLDDDREIPDEILSEVPPVRATLRGSQAARAFATEFLTDLSNSITVVP